LISFQITTLTTLTADPETSLKRKCLSVRPRQNTEQIIDRKAPELRAESGTFYDLSWLTRVHGKTYSTYSNTDSKNMACCQL
jgi:hypothetical protein